MHTITLRGGPYHAETRPVPDPPPFKPAPGLGINRLPSARYYAFHRVGNTWAPTAIYIQDPYRADLFHYLADATPNHLKDQTP